MLEVKNIYAGYGRRCVLNGVTASLEKGRLTSVIGVNGSGKSTFLKAMLGIIPISSGDVVLDGQSLSDLGRRDIAKKLAYLQQGKSTPDMTVEQMVLHGRFPYLSYPRRYTELDCRAARTAMETVGIYEYASEPLNALSGGMRQNAYIAMALAQDTDYVLLDEPTTYLDIAHQLELMRLLRRLADKGKGIAAVMHDLPIAFGFSDSILIIDNGRVAAFDTPSSLCQSPIVKEIFGASVLRDEKSGRYYYGEV